MKNLKNGNQEMNDWSKEEAHEKGDKNIGGDGIKFTNAGSKCTGFYNNNKQSHLRFKL